VHWNVHLSFGFKFCVAQVVIKVYTYFTLTQMLGLKPFIYLLLVLNVGEQ